MAYVRRCTPAPGLARAGLPFRTSSSRTKSDSCSPLSRASVFILQPHDIVFAQIGAGLHLDEVQRLAGNILQAMFCSERNEGRLVLPDVINLVIARHACRA